MSANAHSMEFSPRLCTEMLAANRIADLASYLLATLERAAAMPPVPPGPEARAACTQILQSLSFCLCQPEFQIPPALVARFIAMNATVSDMAAVSAFGTTDFAVEMLAGQPNSLHKLLVLYSPRNRIELDIAAATSLDRQAVSEWYFSFVGAAFGRQAEAWASRHLRRHVEDIGRFDLTLPGANLESVYFGVTYLNPQAEPVVKGTINRLLQARLGQRDYQAAAPVDRRHAVILSGAWFPRHSVHRTNFKFVRALAKSFRLTFVKLNGASEPEADLFDHVIEVDGDNGRLRGLGAAVAFWPDIGMGLDSIISSNLRLAPLQIMGLGHPVSTFGSEIDFFVSGADLESAQTARDNYSERLLLLPGRAVTANPIPWPRRFSQRPDGPVLVALPWSTPKFNPEMFALLRRVADRASHPVRFRLTSIAGTGPIGHAAMVETLRETLGPDRLDIHSAWLDQPAYMDWLSQAHISADSHWFGGFNTVVDALYAGLPPVVFDGPRLYSRFGAHLMRKLGLHDLVVQSLVEYEDVLLRLIDDADWRDHLRRRVEAVNPDDIFEDDETDGDAFRRVVEHLVDHGVPAGRAPVGLLSSGEVGTITWTA